MAGTGWLTGADAGEPLEMSQVMGGGFKTAGALAGSDHLPIMVKYEVKPNDNRQVRADDQVD